MGKVEIKTGKTHTYLGEEIEDSGSNTANVRAKVTKGPGSVKNILQILTEIYLGEHYFEALILLRNSMLISVITSNLEVAMNLTAKEIKMLDDIDMRLLRAGMMVSAKSSRCLLLLELGLVSVKYILKRKRLGYLHYLLTSEDQNLAKMVLQEQVRSPKQWEWLSQVKKDLKDLKIELTISQLASLSKLKFKAILKEATEGACLEDLLREKGKQSKGKELNYSSLELQPYLKSGNGISIENMRHIYFSRCRENFLKANFKSLFQEDNCVAPLCGEKGGDRETHM